VDAETPKADRPLDELRSAVLDYVLAHATQAQPVGPHEVARQFSADKATVWDVMADLAGGGMTRYPEAPPLDARAGQYWSRAT
jgi:hypothetical protein